jgi:6-phosphogluconolactonase (cycloisomerase 2 family)
MNILFRLGAIASATLTATAVLAAPASAAPHHRHDGAVFVQTDDVDGNKVVAYHRNQDGTLTLAARYRTGGRGGSLDGAVVDRTASQGALSYDQRHRLLYAVNAGSDTVTVFAVRGDRLFRVQVAGSGGNFPVSVTTHGNLVYVLNALDGGSIQGFRWEGGRLSRVDGWHRNLGLDPHGIPQFTHTPGQVSFTPDGTQLVVTTKAGSDSLDVFGVGRFGAPARKPVVNTKEGSVPFAVAFDRQKRLVVAETGTNSVVTYRIGPDGRLRQLDAAETGQRATCWVTTSGSRVYASNAGSATVSGYRSTRRGLTSLGDTSTDAGTVDADVTADGHFLYVQTGAAGGIDGFRIASDGTLTTVGSVLVPDAVGAEGIVAI